jgi:hypothetical protein
VLFRKQVDKGAVQAIKGNSSLYIGTYTSGEEFGILNGRIITGDRLEELKKAAAKKAKNQRADDDIEAPKSDEFEEGEISDEELEEGATLVGTEVLRQVDEEEDDEDDDSEASSALDDMLNNIDDEEDDEDKEDEGKKGKDEQPKPSTTSTPVITMGENFNPQGASENDNI